jgi:RNA polymerase sigma-B factor
MRTDQRDLVLDHMHLARRLARRYSSGGRGAEDLTQVAYLGLVKAAGRFDPARGMPFSSFAIPTILGELKRHFRDTRWALHVPRDMQERALRIDRAREHLTRELQRAPTVAELGDHLGLTTEQVIEGREAGRVVDALSLDAPTGAQDDGDSGVSMLDTLGDSDPRFDGVEDACCVRAAVGELGPRARLVLRLRFVDELTQREIGERIGVSQMQVSRILARSFSDVRRAVVGSA